MFTLVPRCTAAPLIVEAGDADGGETETGAVEASSSPVSVIGPVEPRPARPFSSIFKESSMTTSKAWIVAFVPSSPSSRELSYRAVE